MGLNKRVIQRIDNLPENGEWWNRESRDAFIRQAEKLCAIELADGSKLQMGDNEICEILSELYNAVAAEYGE